MDLIKNKTVQLIALTLLLIGLMWSKLPRYDKATYFEFADTRIVLNIQNAGDVLSNLPFLFVGLWGIYGVFRKKSLLFPSYKHGFIILAVGTILTCFGSIYFHLNPNLSTLFWDRLPMTVGFTGLMGLLISDRIGLSVGIKATYALVLLGLISIIGWHLAWFDLRPYLCVQYGCLIFALLTLLLTQSNVLKNSQILLALSLYIVAKFTELYDQSIFDSLQLISGHTLKHLLAAVAIYIMFSPLAHSKKYA
jgi:hypothetical protein